MGDKTIFVVLVLVASLAIVHSLGFSDALKYFNMLKNGFNATCVTIPDFVKEKIIPARCVKCENNAWSLNVSVSLTSLRKCVSAANGIGVNAIVFVTSVSLSLFALFHWKNLAFFISSISFMEQHLTFYRVFRVNRVLYKTTLDVICTILIELHP